MPTGKKVWSKGDPSRCTISDRLPGGGSAVFSRGFRKMRFSTRLVAAIIGVLMAGTAWAQGTGRSLDIQPGARENGMGATGVALGDDATGATWWNPAALGFTTRPSIQLTTAQLVPG